MHDIYATLHQIRDIGDLCRFFTKTTPGWFREQKDVPELPFPGHIVEGIESEHVAILERTLLPLWPLDPNREISDGIRYMRVANIFIRVNKAFIQSDQFDSARTIANGMVAAAKELRIPVALVFLMTAEAYLEENDKQHMISQRKQLLSSRDRVFKESHECQQAIKVILHTISRKDAPINTDEDMWIFHLKDNLDMWTEHQDLRQRLEDLDAVLGLLQYSAQAEVAIPIQHVPHKRKDFTPYTWRAYEQIEHLVAKNFRAYGADQEATRLFDLWGINITPGAIKKRRQRMSPKRGQSPGER